jgi:hypothetical protein
MTKALGRIWTQFGIFLLVTSLALLVGEAYFSVAKLAPENDDRFLEPYLMGGDLIKSGEPGFPSDYGYEKRGLFYYYPYR